MFALSLNSQTVLFKPIDRTLSGPTTLSQSEPGSNGNERVLNIPHISKAGASQSDCLMSCPEHSLGVVYSTAQVNWAETIWFWVFISFFQVCKWDITNCRKSLDSFKTAFIHIWDISFNTKKRSIKTDLI